MPVLKRTALLILMLVGLLVAGQGAIHLQSALAFAAGKLPWLPLLKIAGGLAGIAWGWRELRRLDREREEVTERHAAKPGRRFQADSNPLLQAGVLTGFLGLTVLLFLMDLDRGQAWLPWGMLAFTGYMGFLLIQGQPDDTPTVGMDAAGIDHAWFGRIPWDQVHGIGLEQQQIQVRRRTYSLPMLVLGVARPDRFLQRAPVSLRLGQEQGFTPGAAYGELRIPLGPLDERPARVVQVAKDLRAQVSPPVLAGWRIGMRETDVRRQMAATRTTPPA